MRRLAMHIRSIFLVLAITLALGAALIAWHAIYPFNIEPLEHRQP